MSDRRSDKLNRSDVGVKDLALCLTLYLNKYIYMIVKMDGTIFKREVIFGSNINLQCEERPVTAIAIFYKNAVSSFIIYMYSI
jgi:hypothetical protein